MSRSNSRMTAIEGLEPRSLFSITVTPNSPATGNLLITGDGSGDLIEVFQSGTSINVYLNGSYHGTASPLPNLITINAGGGNDVVGIDTSVSSSIPIRINGEGGNDTLAGANTSDTITGGDGTDYIDGNSGNDSLYGDGSSDTLLGGPGSDALYGGDGNDTMAGETGADSIRGENGSDLVDYSGSTAAVKVSLDNSANDGIYGAGGTSTELDNVFNTTEQIGGSSYNDSIDASMVSFSVTLNGGGGNDTLAGGSAIDLIDGGSGTDSLVGSVGSDTVLNIP